MDEWVIFEHVKKLEPDFQTRLHGYGEHPLVGNTRGKGLIGAVELVKNKATKEAFDVADGVGQYCMERCRHHGLIVRVLAGDAIAFCPPLIVTSEQVDEIFSKFELALADTLNYVQSLEG